MSILKRKEAMKTTSTAYSRGRGSAPAGAIADIAFLLLIFFLVTTQIPQEQGISTQLPPFALQPPAPIAERNVLSVLINAEGQLLADGESVKLEELPALIRQFVRNPERAAHLAAAPTKAVISLGHDRSTSYADYLAVYDRILYAYRSLWDEQALAQYGAPYKALSASRKKQIRSKVPLVISEAEPLDLR